MNLGELSGLIGGLVGFILTVMVFFYILGDNFLFRLAIHIFIGVAAGYMLMIAIQNIIVPRLYTPLVHGAPQEAFLALVPLGLSIMLLGKLGSRFSALGRPVMAFLVGIGAATAVGGAVTGTLFPQVSATSNLLNLQAIQASGKPMAVELFNGMLILVGTVSTLAYFQFGARNVAGKMQRPMWLQILAWVGQFFIAIALAAVFAGVYAAALTALVDRLGAMIQLFIQLVSPPV